MADGDLAACRHLCVDAHIDVAKARPRAATISRSRSAVAGFTWVAAHLVIGEITPSRTAPMVTSELIQSCSLQADAPLK
jgi:hypothetical protein